MASLRSSSKACSVFLRKVIFAEDKGNTCFSLVFSLVVVCVCVCVCVCMFMHTDQYALGLCLYMCMCSGVTSVEL